LLKSEFSLKTSFDLNEVAKAVVLQIGANKCESCASSTSNPALKIPSDFSFVSKNFDEIGRCERLLWLDLALEGSQQLDAGVIPKFNPVKTFCNLPFLTSIIPLLAVELVALF
jgi:hypothetical protein